MRHCKSPKARRKKHDILLMIERPCQMDGRNVGSSGASPKQQWVPCKLPKGTLKKDKNVYLRGKLHFRNLESSQKQRKQRPGTPQTNAHISLRSDLKPNYKRVSYKTRIHTHAHAIAKLLQGPPISQWYKTGPSCKTPETVDHLFLPFGESVFFQNPFL